MERKPHFIALLTFASAEESNKTTPVSSGYRATIHFSFEQNHFTGIQNFMDTDLVFPGDVVNAEITLLNIENFKEKLYQGLDFDFYENENLIGHGVVVKVTHP
ncbi:hypothetical protein ACFPVY_17305 [Flavobacterium qiangtangense]|uniref:Translation elongation factor EFTu/EF1A C-terminal domain-containing protein n=1 Tax=Flavobacterium qiangtangense TaxID=1442595 RepID=A0ABW1PS67_9FLAO